MTWWIHLLVRRVDSLRERCDTLERVLRAGVVHAGIGGGAKYLRRAEELFVRYKMHQRHQYQVQYQVYGYCTITVNATNHAVCDRPSGVTSLGSRLWRKDEVLHRETGPAYEYVWWTDDDYEETEVHGMWYINGIRRRSRENLFTKV